MKWWFIGNISCPDCQMLVLSDDDSHLDCKSKRISINIFYINKQHKKMLSLTMWMICHSCHKISLSVLDWKAGFRGKNWQYWTEKQDFMEKIDRGQHFPQSYQTYLPVKPSNKLSTVYTHICWLLFHNKLRQTVSCRTDKPLCGPQDRMPEPYQFPNCSLQLLQHTDREIWQLSCYCSYWLYKPVH